MSKKGNNVLNNFSPYKNKKSILKKQNIEKNYKDLISESLDIRSYAKDNLL